MDYKIPLFDLNFDDKEETAVLETLRSKWISIGPKTAELESKFNEMFSCQYSLGLANCTVALHLALLLLGIKQGDEVITPSLTFVATVNSIRYVNAIPVFCDVKSLEDLTIDPDAIEAKISSKTKAIIVMHYAGFPCDMNRILHIAKKYNLKVIEDACHAPLSEYQGKKLGTIGDIGAFSFFSNKNISTGEGGVLVTNSAEYYEKGKLLRSHGMTTLSYERSKGHNTSYDVVELGFNYRIDDIHSAIALAQLGKLKNDIQGRIRVRERYLKSLGSNKKVIIPFRDNREFVSNYIFPIILKDSNSDQRDQVRNHLHEAGIQTSVHYPAVHRFSIYKNYNASLRNTDYVTDNEITLPMYSKLNDEQIDYIGHVVNKAL